MHDNRQTDDSGTGPVKNRPSGKDSVEDGWKSELVDDGVDEDRAEDIVSMLQSSTDLVLGNPSENDVDEALRTAIEETDFDRYGAEHPQRLTSALLRVLDEWQDGTRAPPVAAAPRTSPTDWENRINGDIEDTDGTDDATDAEDANTDNESTEAADQRGSNESVTTIQGDPISPDPDLEPQADPGQEGIAGGAGPINDDQEIVKDAVDARQDSGSQASESAQSPAAAPETVSEKAEQPEAEAAQSAETGTDDSETDERRQEVDLPEAVVRSHFDRNEEVINSRMEQPVELVEDEMISFGASAVNVYRDLVKNALFAGMSDTEQELLYEKLVEDRIKGRGRRNNE